MTTCWLSDMSAEVDDHCQFEFRADSVFLRGDVQVELLSLALQESRAAPLIGPKFVTRSYLSVRLLTLYTHC